MKLPKIKNAVDIMERRKYDASFTWKQSLRVCVKLVRTYDAC